MKGLLYTALLLSVILTGCVMPASVKQGDQALLAGNHIEAVKQYNIGLAQATESSIRAKIEKKLTQAKTILADIYTSKATKALIEAPDRDTGLNSAIATLEEVVRWDDPKHRISTELNKYRQEKAQLQQEKDERMAICRDALQKAQILLPSFKFHEAQIDIERAQKIDPENEDISKTRDILRQLTTLYDKMERQIKEGKLHSSLDTFEKIATISPATLEFSQLPIRYLYRESILKEIETLSQQQRWLSAYKFLKRWPLPGLEIQLSELQFQASAAYLDRALLAEQEGKHFLAYLLSEQAKDFDGRNTGIFDLHKKTGDYVDKSLQQYIAIASFDSPTNDPDSGMQFSDSLTSYLYTVLPYGINILERDKIDYILKEKNTDTQNIGDILGANIIITGRVSLFQVETTSDHRNVKVKVKTGEEVVQNPEYTQMFNLYGRDQQTWPSVPPQTITRETSEMVTYSKGSARLKGIAKVSVRIFDTAKAAITFVSDYPASIEDICEFQDEVPQAGIEFKPKSLISAIEAKDAMRKEIVTEIGKVVQSSFDSREIRFLNEANLFLERREPEQALKPLAQGFLYCKKGNLAEDNKTCGKIKTLIDTHIE